MKFFINDIVGNRIEIDGEDNEFELDGIKFELLEEIREVETDLTIPKEKLDEYSIKYKNLVKSLLDEGYSLNDVNKITFCKFKLNENIENIRGVYIWVVENEIKYIGETIRLKDRFNTGYGIISPRNIFRGGQSTNCKMNRMVGKNIKNNHFIKIYFHKTEQNNHKKIEKQLLSKYRPQYNKKK